MTWNCPPRGVPSAAKRRAWTLWPMMSLPADPLLSQAMTKLPLVSLSIAVFWAKRPVGAWFASGIIRPPLWTVHSPSSKESRLRS